LPDLEYAAESSADLATWTPAALEVLETGATETLRASAARDPGDAAPRFLRLRLVRP
jgi:hypothetical protein